MCFKNAFTQMRSHRFRKERVHICVFFFRLRFIFASTYAFPIGSEKATWPACVWQLYMCPQTTIYVLIYICPTRKKKGHPGPHAGQLYMCCVAGVYVAAVYVAAVYVVAVCVAAVYVLRGRCICGSCICGSCVCGSCMCGSCICVAWLYASALVDSCVCGSCICVAWNPKP
jgi:hypothetical protein